MVENTLLSTQAPQLSLDDAQELAQEIYGIDASVTPLTSERDQNFRLQTSGGASYVLKVTNPAEPREVTDFQTRAQRHLMQSDDSLQVPQLIPTLDGNDIHWLEHDGRMRAVRMMSFLPGVPLYKTARSPGQRRQLGATLARFDLALRGFSHPAARHELLWDIQHAQRLRKLLVHIDDVARLRLAHAWMDNFEMHVLPRLPALRQQVIHNDLNPYNVLVADESGAGAERITAILDFGDMVAAPLVNDLAIACSYQLSDGDNPLATAVECVAAYHAVCPLTEAEVDVLFDLIATRLLITVAITGWRAALYPENRAYILRNNPLSWAGLESFSGLPRVQAQQALRAACGFRSKP
jgi:Ser/Thr protein kinase RdoA (MazF antagonist)